MSAIINMFSSISVTTYILIGVILSVVCAILSAFITKLRKGLIEDVVFSGVFGLLFNVMALLFVFFRKPVWNNLGWIPVVIAWFFIDANIAVATVLCAYAIVWAVSQHKLLERIKVVEE